MEHYFTNNSKLKSEFRNVYLHILEDKIEFISDLGVFSKDKVDYGSKLLIETFLKDNENYESVLDLGCGYGVIGLTIKKYKSVSVTLADVNKRALHLTEMNAKRLKLDVNILESNIYENINDTFDVIITNPPIRAGKSVITEFIMGASKHLNEDGSLYIVMRKDQGAKSMMETMKSIYNVNILEKSKGFYIIKAKLIDN
jgi:ribosomal protein L11 methyltransferase (prmA)